MRASRAVDAMDGVERVSGEFDVVTSEALGEPRRQSAFGVVYNENPRS